MRPRATGIGARRLPLGAFLVAATMTVAVIGAWTPTVRGDRAEKGEARTSQASRGLYGSETWYRWAEYVPSGSRFAPHPSFNHLVQWHPEAECSGAVLSVN